MRNKITVLYFFAYWDDAALNKKDFINLCEYYGVKYENIDVETEIGLKMSKRYKIKMCPRIVVLNGKQVIATLNGRHLSELEDILHAHR